MKNPIFIFLTCLSTYSFLVAQTFTEVTYLDRPHYRIETKTATYFYDPTAGGFSSILDANGNDWVAFQDQPWNEYPASSASSFRGLPNLVHNGDDKGVGYPGHKKCSSQIIGNQIQTSSQSEQWAWTWTFYESYAKLDITKAASDQAYWFMYAGTAGGTYSPKVTRWGTNIKGPQYDRFDHYNGSTHEGYYRWFYFNGPNSKQTFWIAHEQVDELPDHYSLLGNTDVGIDAGNGMLIAGFGRKSPEVPLLTGLQSFYIGFYKKPVDRKGRHRAISKLIGRLIDKTP